MIINNQGFECCKIPRNKQIRLEIIKKIKNKYENLDIITDTGYTFEELQDIVKSGVMSYSRLLSNIDYLIDGRFEQEKASLDCAWRGSTNQRIIDVKESLSQNKVVETEL